MSFENRIELIQNIQEKRNSTVVTYILGDRVHNPAIVPLPGIIGKVATDVKPIFQHILSQVGYQQNIDLFVFTRGGDTNAVWPIVSLFREYCENLSVLIPFRCHSSGTMICLGANKVYMTKIAELSPIDPQTGNQFNPIDDFSKNRKGISVEDLNSYYDLGKDNFNLKDEADLEMFKELTKAVHPLALGNVKRVLSQSNLLSKKLLSLHLDPEENEELFNTITDTLTVKFFSHLHYINRKEAKEIFGDNIVQYPDADLENDILNLYYSYAESLKLNNTFCLFSEMGNHPEREVTLYNGLIESTQSSYCSKTRMKVFQRSELPQNMRINLQPGQTIPIIPGYPKSIYTEVFEQGWIINEEEV